MLFSSQLNLETGPKERNDLWDLRFINNWVSVTEASPLIYRLDMTRRGVYWSRQRFTGCIASCWKLVYSRVRLEGEDRGGVWTVSQEREDRVVWSRLHMFALCHPLLSVLIWLWVASLPPSMCVIQFPSFSFLSHLPCSQKLLFSLGGSFLYYADHFKLYSGFCANHIKVQKVLERGMKHTLKKTQQP